MRLTVITFLLLFLLSLGAHAQDDSCTCERGELMANVRNAETIFYGSIQEATMKSAKSDTIQLTLQIRDPIRGVESGTEKVSTTLPHNCGVRATLGMHSLFVISSDDKPVTRCGGSGSHHYQQGHELYDLYNLVFAIFAVEYVDRDPSVVRSWLGRLYSPGHSRKEDMDGLFSLISELDTETIMTITDHEVMYRNMTFVFTDDDVLVDYLWKDEN